MTPVTLYDARSGLSRDYDMPVLSPKIILPQYDARYLYEREFELEKRLTNGRYLYGYRRTRKEPLP